MYCAESTTEQMMSGLPCTNVPRGRLQYEHVTVSSPSVTFRKTTESFACWNLTFHLRISCFLLSFSISCDRSELHMFIDQDTGISKSES